VQFKIKLQCINYELIIVMAYPIAGGPVGIRLRQGIIDDVQRKAAGGYISMGKKAFFVFYVCHRITNKANLVF
jgi:hypothetical protein